MTGQSWGWSPSARTGPALYLLPLHTPALQTECGDRDQGSRVLALVCAPALFPTGGQSSPAGVTGPQVTAGGPEAARRALNLMSGAGLLGASRQSPGFMAETGLTFSGEIGCAGASSQAWQPLIRSRFSPRRPRRVSRCSACAARCPQMPWKHLLSLLGSTTPRVPGSQASSSHYRGGWSHPRPCPLLGGGPGEGGAAG